MKILKLKIRRKVKPYHFFIRDNEKVLAKSFSIPYIKASEEVIIELFKLKGHTIID